MADPSLTLFWQTLELPDPDTPLYRQLYDAVRDAVLAGTLQSGERVPATRNLAKHLNVSRNTVLEAFEQLFAEGYLETAQGKGTFVAEGIAVLSDGQAVDKEIPLETPVLSARGTLLAQSSLARMQEEVKPLAFQAGLPALAHFPWKLWTRLTTQAAEHLADDPQRMGYIHSAGVPELRSALADYLRASRGVRCTADNVLIVSGTQHAIDLTVRLLVNPGEAVWLENPGYSSGHAVVKALGAKVVPVPVDADGLAFERAPELGKLAYVTPSHQYPLGMTMSLRRRLALLEHAKTHNLWLFEDDYDSEFRYAGKPLAALQSLDSHQRVIYAGTLSKVLFPGLRLGYVVVPPALVDAFAAARALVDRTPPVLSQMTLALFIQEGHFARHIRRMRALYKKRRQVLLEHIQQIDVLEHLPSDTGLQFSVRLPAGWDDAVISQALLAAGVEARPLASYAHAPLPFSGLNLGYGAANEAVIAASSKTMREVLEHYATSR
jgi:GntR family transcriptional regulator/MocR family aminotransferase